ncbi:MAG TPA: hypothetical protein VGK16_14110 [Candidatus Limnocylindrales bacterium]
MPPKSNHGQGHGHASEAGAAGGFRNHGAEVSAAAHDAPRGRGEGHGQAVSDIARGGLAAPTPAMPSPTPAAPSTSADVAADDPEPGA